MIKNTLLMFYLFLFYFILLFNEILKIFFIKYIKQGNILNKKKTIYLLY